MEIKAEGGKVKMELSSVELKSVVASLLMQQKSVMRLAAKEGQPETVAAEYRKVAKQIDDLLKKFAFAA